MGLISPHDNFAFVQDVFVEADKFECHFGGNSAGKQIVVGVWLIDLTLFVWGFFFLRDDMKHSVGARMLTPADWIFLLCCFSLCFTQMSPFFFFFSNEFYWGLNTFGKW